MPETIVLYECPKHEHKGDGHTVGRYSFGNAAGGRWGAALRPQICELCGAEIVAAQKRTRLNELKREALAKLALPWYFSRTTHGEDGEFDEFGPYPTQEEAANAADNMGYDHAEYSESLEEVESVYFSEPYQGSWKER